MDGKIMRTSRACVVFLLTVAARPVAAQVPRFEASAAHTLAGLRSLDAQTRRTAASALQRARPDENLRLALQTALLQDPDSGVRQAAAVALAKIGGAKGKKVLAQAGICDPDPTVRNGLAAFARQVKLQCHQQPEPADRAAALPAGDDELLATLGHPSPATRLAAARELIRRSGSRAGASIWPLVSRDPSPQVRIGAVRMLARNYGQQLLPALQHALRSDPDVRVREVVLEALAFLRAPQSVPWIASSARVEELGQVQAAAVAALARIGSPAAAEQLRELGASASLEETRAAAVAALAALPAERARSQSLFARALKQDKSGKVRAAALRALSGDNSVAACTARAERLRDADAEVRRAVVDQMAHCSAQLARPKLQSVLKDDRDPAVRRAAAEILIKAGAAKSLEALGAALVHDKDKALRARCLAALAALRVKERGAPLCEAAKNDPEPELRKAAIAALERLPAEVVVPALSVVLSRDRAADVRLEATRLLSRYRDASAYEALQKAAAQDGAAEVRKAAAAGAAKSPAQRAFVESLLPQVIDPSAAVRLKATTQLCSVQVPSTYRALLLALLTDEDAGVRTLVAKCFADIDHPLVDVGLSVAHATDTDGNVIHAVEVSQKQRVERQTRLLEKAKSQDPAERTEVARALQPSPNKQVREMLEQLMEKDPEVKVRRSAMVSVARYRDRRALERLNACSQLERDPVLRQTMVATYNQLRTFWGLAKAALNINGLVQDLRAASPETRLRAAQALQVLRDRRAFQALREAARHPTDAPLRHAAVLALGSFGDHAIISQSARTETDPAVKNALIQLNYLRTAGPEKILGALASSKADEVHRGIEAAAVKTTPTAVPWLVRVAMTHVDAGLREAGVRALAVYDHPLARWAVRVAAVHEARKRTRATMWRWAVHTDAGAD